MGVPTIWSLIAISGLYCHSNRQSRAKIIQYVVVESKGTKYLKTMKRQGDTFPSNLENVHWKSLTKASIEKTSEGATPPPAINF